MQVVMVARLEYWTVGFGWYRWRMQSQINMMWRSNLFIWNTTKENKFLYSSIMSFVNESVKLFSLASLFAKVSFTFGLSNWKFFIFCQSSSSFVVIFYFIVVVEITFAFDFVWKTFMDKTTNNKKITDCEQTRNLPIGVYWVKIAVSNCCRSNKTKINRAKPIIERIV